MSIRKKLTFAIALGGFLLPAASAFALPGQSEQLKQSPEVFFFSGNRSYLGVDIQDVTADRVSALKLKEERGVEVTMVDQDAPAGKAGLKEHDVILEFNGIKVESGEQIRRLIRETPAGRTVALGISRDGGPMTISVQLADRGKVAAENMPRIVIPRPMPAMPEINIPSIQLQILSPTIGVQVESVGRQLGEYFGIKNGEGILVKSVEKSSPADKAGLKAGDIIVKADNEKVSDRSDLRRVIRNHRKGGKVALGIVRDRKEQTITVDLPEPKTKDSSGIYLEMPDVDIVTGEISDLIQEVQEIGPETRRIVINELPQVREAVRASVRQIQPEVEKTVRQTKQSLKRLKKQVREQLKYDDMI
jgi:membrane-associated protease RseP (regulator of RpoE activity)